MRTLASRTWATPAVVGLTAALSFAASGCFLHHAADVDPELHSVEVHQGAVVVTGPPPPAPVEVAPSPPGEHDVWIPGYWTWDGAAYAWTPGRFVAAQAGVIWIAPRYVYRDRVHLYFHGHWGRHHTPTH